MTGLIITMKFSKDFSAVSVVCSLGANARHLNAAFILNQKSVQLVFYGLRELWVGTEKENLHNGGFLEGEQRTVSAGGALPPRRAVTVKPRGNLMARPAVGAGVRDAGVLGWGETRRRYSAADIDYGSRMRCFGSFCLASQRVVL